MKLLVFRGHVTKIIKMVSWGTRLHRIHRPGRRSKVARVHICSRIPEHLFASIVAPSYRVNPHFYFIQAYSDHNFHKKSIPINCWIYQKCGEKQDEYSQNKHMAPNKLQHLQGGVQGILQIVNGRNLHGAQQLYLIKYRIAQIFLRICKIKRSKVTDSKYIGQNHNTHLNDKE